MAVYHFMFACVFRWGTLPPQSDWSPSYDHGLDYARVNVRTTTTATTIIQATTTKTNKAFLRSGAFVVLTSILSFFPTTSVHPVSVLILHPINREIPVQIVMWSQTVRQSKPNSRNSSKKGKASEVLAYRVDNTTKQARLY